MTKPSSRHSNPTGSPVVSSPVVVSTLPVVPVVVVSSAVVPLPVVGSGPVVWPMVAVPLPLLSLSDPPLVKNARVSPSGAKKVRSSSASSITLSFEVPRKIE